MHLRSPVRLRPCSPLLRRDAFALWGVNLRASLAKAGPAAL
jgi:hypothetical protein